MPLFRKLSNINSPFSDSSRGNVKERESNLRSKSSSVSHEYMQAFRTKSYVEIYTKVQTQLVGAATTLLRSTSSSSSSPLPRQTGGCDLLQLCQETLAGLPQEASHSHPLFSEYFHISLEACKTCESLLKNIIQTRTNYKSIKAAIDGVREFPKKAVWSEEQLNSVYTEFKSFSSLRNPLSSVAQVRFNEIQDGHLGLLRRLTSSRRKLKRKIKLLRLCKKAVGSGLVVGYAAFAVAFTVVAVHCAICLAAAPGLISISLGIPEMLKKWRRGRRLAVAEGVYTQLDTAAKGVYILINDFDTMSRLVGRLYDETEHNRAIADLCTRKQNDDMLKEVVRDFEAHEGWFLEHLKELEQHIYLCFLNIIRSRRMIVQQIMEFEKTLHV